LLTFAGVLFCVIHASNAFAQISQNLLIGLTPSRSVFHFATSLGAGYSIEPEIKYSIDRLMVGANIGVSKYNASREGIVDRFITGHYFETGVEVLLSRANFEKPKGVGFSISVHYFQSFANETGKFYLKNSFGDHYQQYERKNLRTNGVKLSSNIWVHVGKKFQLVVCPRINIADPPNRAPYNQLPIDVPLNYMPGAGAAGIEVDPDYTWIAVGADVKLFYNLFSR
jgi:hypothetical protein